MPTYKLYYFDLRGRAEHIRHMFVIAGVPFEDIRLIPEVWPQHKDEMPIGKVPVLEVEGVKIGESVAIARFLGREFHMNGKTSVENALLDMLGDVIADATNSEFIRQWPLVLMGRINEKKEDFFKNKVMPDLEKFLPHIEKFLLQNKNGLLVGEKETWVDVFAAEFFSKFIDYGEKDCLHAYPHILALINRIHNIPSLRKYIQQRAPTVC